jgi:uncharacterized OsmC-like protein
MSSYSKKKRMKRETCKIDITERTEEEESRG